MKFINRSTVSAVIFLWGVFLPIFFFFSIYLPYYKKEVVEWSISNPVVVLSWVYE